MARDFQFEGALKGHGFISVFSDRDGRARALARTLSDLANQAGRVRASARASSRNQVSGHDFSRAEKRRKKGDRASAPARQPNSPGAKAPNPTLARDAVRAKALTYQSCTNTRFPKMRFCSAVLFLAVAPVALFSQSPERQSVVLDRVVAVVNNQPILSSDVDDALRLSVLDAGSEAGTLTRPRALDELISRDLIRQQMRREEIVAATPTQAEVDARLREIRAQLPQCEKANCATLTGWGAFLAARGLTEERVESYMRNRMEILRFIEQRFRQGNRVSPQQVETYYRDTLLPQYAPGVQPPKLEAVAPRIEEILLQQQVNALFDDWLKNLREQGDIEVLDPALESARLGAAAGGAEE